LSEESDEELIARCASGDGRGMDVLVGRYHGKLLEFAVRQLSDREAAADIAQTTLVRAFRSAAGFRARSSFRTWLYAIELNLIREELRKRKRRSESMISELPDGDNAEAEWPEEGESPEDATLRRVKSQSLWEAVGKLSRDQRTAVVLKFRGELTYDEIAEAMGAPSGTAKSWVHYALKSLRKLIEPEDKL
jgi:RNA polymerase sigma-70 factor, ECF subfamily